MNKYVEVAYQEKEKPFGEYPLQLAKYLKERFHLSEGMRILDNGCGRGEFLHAFSSLGLEASGTDISDYCKAAKVVDLNCEPLPFPDDYFDAVFSKSVIEHIENTEHYMKEMRRVLRRGGSHPDGSRLGDAVLDLLSGPHAHPPLHAKIHGSVAEYERV